MDIPPEWEAHFPETVQALLDCQLPQHTLSGYWIFPGPDSFSQDDPHGYERVLDNGLQIPPLSIIAALQSSVGEISGLGFQSIKLLLNPPTQILFPLWVVKYWKLWSIAIVSHKGWSDPEPMKDSGGLDFL